MQSFPGRPRERGFPPLAGPQATVLVLGSLPGRASLDAYQYYAHSRNAFWRIVAELLQVSPDSSYTQRVDALTRSHIAVWDVLRSGVRPASSLDSAIVASTVVPNDFTAFFTAHPQVSRVFFNGAAAENLYRRHVLPALQQPHCELRLARLPSTSPANARLDFDAKREAWQVLTEGEREVSRDR